MKIRMTIEVQLETGMELPEGEERIWAENEIFIGDGSLLLHSNEVGDTVGIVKKVGKIQWIED